MVCLQLGRQLIAAALAELGVFGLVDAAGLGEDLGGDLVVGAGLLLRCCGGDLGTVDCEDCIVREPGLGAESEDLAEEGERAAPRGGSGKRAIVAWSGVRFAAITRKATSSRSRCSIRREERSPIA